MRANHNCAVQNSTTLSPYSTQVKKSVIKISLPKYQAVSGKVAPEIYCTLNQTDGTTKVRSLGCKVFFVDEKWFQNPCDKGLLLVLTCIIDYESSNDWEHLKSYIIGAPSKGRHKRWISQDASLCILR